jgi:predicted adenine nucleotide alpha hydrolase (AANH) superfamily ATPase
MKVVLHICCGICAAAAAERLIGEGHQVLGFFSNPNIHPDDEYRNRLKVAVMVAEELNFPLEVADYTPEVWFAETESLKDEFEGGQRCEVCFWLRLKQTYRYLQDCGGDTFTTTLTIGPRKSAETVNRIGREIGGDRFLARDFKKKAGFQRATELAKQWALYRQHYCGCLYSKRKDPTSLRKGEG